MPQQRADGVRSAAAARPSRRLTLVLDHARHLRGGAALAFYAWLNFGRLEIFKMLLSSFFPLAC